MLKPLTLSVSDVSRAAQADLADSANSVFKVLHGTYGNLFLNKYATGMLVDKPGDPRFGQDLGIISSRQVWAQGLKGFEGETIKEALLRCIELHPKFPPNLGEFVVICKACAPREVYRPAVPALGMSQALRSQRAARSREIVTRHRFQDIKAAAAAAPLVPGLDALKQAIADACACAGGNEAAELRRLDVMFAQAAA